MAATRTPRSFGAMIDGKTDDTKAYQAAIDAAGAEGGGDVVVERGISRISNLTMSAGVALVAEAAGGYRAWASVLQAAAGSSGAMITVPDSVQHCGAIGVRFIGIADGASTVSRGVDLLGDWGQVANCSFFNFNDQGLIVDGLANKVIDCLGVSCVQNRTRQRITGALEVYGTDHYLERNQFGCGYSGLKSPFGPFPPPATADRWVCGVALLAANCFLNATHGENADIGIRIAGPGGSSRLVNCRGDFVSADGIVIENGGNQLTNCLAQSVGQCPGGDGQYDGFLLTVTSAANILVNCQQYDAKVNRARFAFNDAVNSSSPHQRNTFLACRGTNYRTAEFNVNTYLGSSPNGSAMRVLSVPDATVIDVTGASLFDLRGYTKGTRVTGFSNGANKQIDLVGSKNVVLGYDPQSILTNTGADKPLQSGRIYRLTNVNGVWIEDGA